MKKGNITRYFPGNNTPDGYCSFFEYILPLEIARKIIIIKGGPGVGKSTMIRKIAKELTKRGLDIELLHCTADSDSLDGLIVKDYNIALVDGTAPHIIDPKFPGCVDEIVNLGEYWDESGLLKQKNLIFFLQEKVKCLYKRVYKYLKTSRIILDDLNDIYKGATTNGLIELKTKEIINDISKDEDVIKSNKIHLQRHMFASGITPEGSLHFLNDLFRNIHRRFIILGNPGTGKSILLKNIYEYAVKKRFDADVFHCPMAPEKIEHLIIPELSVGFITSIKPHILSDIRSNDNIIDMDSALDYSRLKDFKKDIEYNNSLSWELFERAIQTLKRVKQTRTELENIYASNMDFHIINKIHEQMLAKILSYTEQKT